LGQLAEPDNVEWVRSFLFTDLESSFGTENSCADSRLEQRKTKLPKEEETQTKKTKTAFRERKKMN